MTLRDQHARFVAAYRKSLNAGEAAIEAGYSAPRARKTGWDLLQREDVKAALAEEQARVIQTARLTEEHLLERLALIVDGAEKDADRIAAIKLYGQHIGMFKASVHVEHSLSLEELILGKPKGS